MAKALRSQISLSELEMLARVHTVQCVETLVEVMTNREEKGSARVAAAGMLLDRAWGKSKQVVELQTSVELLSDEALQEAISSRLAHHRGIVSPTTTPGAIIADPWALEHRDQQDSSDGASAPGRRLITLDHENSDASKSAAPEDSATDSSQPSSDPTWRSQGGSEASGSGPSQSSGGPRAGEAGPGAEEAPDPDFSP